MPTSPNDAFNVLTEDLDESEIEGDDWDSSLDEEKDDDTDFKVATKHRASKAEVDEAVDEEPKTTKRKSKKAEKKQVDTAETKADSNPVKPVSKSVKKQKKGGKKRPPGKVGHTRGPGVDLK